MNWIDQIGGMLQQYTDPQNSSTANAEQDFDQVAGVAPREAVSSSLAEAFRSTDTPPFGNMLGSLFGQSNGSQRASILNTLLATAGPALLSGVLSRSGGLGNLGSLLQGGQPITPEVAQQVSPEAVQEIAHEAEKRDPGVVDRVSDFYAQHPTLVKGLGAAALAFMMKNMAGQKRGMF